MQALEAILPGSTVQSDRETHKGRNAGQNLGTASEAKAPTLEFEDLLAASASLAFRMAMGVLHNRADAEEVAQDALLRAYKNFGSLRDRNAFRGWLARIAWRLALDRQRGTRRRERRELAAPNTLPQQDVEQVAAASEFELHLARAMDELPEKYRQTLILAAIEGYSTAEVAALLDLPEGTVKSRLYSARKILAEKLSWVAPNIRNA
jgi:RNA polymerase sigma-70 factor, ECF subfamily